MPGSRRHRTVITRVRVFDGQQVTEPRTVVVEDGIIRADLDTAGARVVDADGSVLLPGLIDSHVHLSDLQALEQFAAHGVTTALDMGTWPPSLVDYCVTTPV
ncbi:hypothetical protein GCM10011609_35020 [Lentzea pudingi]|uniref:Amidohydrolase family protein n=1 Tax=Lentzea pudingi TaxID=1789439 RepID=A0ABQ2HYI6_9PSEU|nr:hypothetical protein GCM10011609_35020 [Lentzea pudingi]